MVLADLLVASAAAAVVEDELVDGFVVDEAAVKNASLTDYNQGKHVQNDPRTLFSFTYSMNFNLCLIIIN